MRLRKLLLILLLGPLLTLLIYEAVAVARARARTPEVLERVSRREVPLSAVPARRLRMILAIDDPGFYGHRGIDLSTPGQGLTTLTQSLAKFLYFERFTPGFAKLELMLIARFALDPAMSKRDQLEVYLNYAPFGSRNGRPIVGFADAARTFYGRELPQLTDREFLTLAAMPIAPRDLDPLRHPEANAERTGRIEALLAGRCRPNGLRDVYYDDCGPRSVSRRE